VALTRCWRCTYHIFILTIVASGEVMCIRRHETPVDTVMRGDMVMLAGSCGQRQVKNGLRMICLRAFSVSLGLSSCVSLSEVVMR